MSSAQTRVDATHPHEIYADFQLPDRIGLVVICGIRPPEVRPMRALEIVNGQRTDGRQTFRLSLIEPALRPVFAALCQDIVACTRVGVVDSLLALVVIQRLTHWRTLMDRETGGLGEMMLRGLIGELVVLRDDILPELGPEEAVRAWKGPFGAPQDFIKPDGRRIEVKTTRAHAGQVRINGLHQLDGCGDPLALYVVRTEDSSPDAPRAMTAPRLIAHLLQLLEAEPQAVDAFEAALRALCWHDHQSHSDVALRLLSIERHDVGDGFPKLTKADVPSDLLDADYVIALPGRRAQGGDQPL